MSGRTGDRLGDRSPERDQASGLRRLFAADRPRVVSLVSNPQVTWSGMLIEHVGRAAVRLGFHPLILDAADTAPQAGEWCLADGGGLVAHRHVQASYLGSRGLLRRTLMAGRSGDQLVDAAFAAAPWADVLIVHAPADDLAGLHGPQAWSPLMMVDTRVDSLVQAYAALKRLSRRGLPTWSLMIEASAHPVLGPRLASRLDDSARRFLSWGLHRAIVVHGHADEDHTASRQLTDLLESQLGSSIDPTSRDSAIHHLH